MNIKVQFQEIDAHFGRVQFQEISAQFTAGFQGFQRVTDYIGGEPYEGEYEITPKVNAQKMDTANKLLLEDVTVRAIPIYDVSNTSGGSTVYIANEI